MIHKVILYGAGERCKHLSRILQQTDIEIAAIIDSDRDKWGDTIEGNEIMSPECMQKYCEEWFCITVADFRVKKMILESLCEQYHCDEKKEIHYNKLILEAYKQCLLIRKKIEKRNTDDQKESILFDCYNGLVLGGVEAWTVDLCETLIKSGKNRTFIISDNGNYDIPDWLVNHILSADINHQNAFAISSIKSLIEIILGKLPCKVITCTTNEVMLAAYLVKLFYPEKIQILSVIHNSNERVYKEYMDFRECPDYYISVSQDIKRDMVGRGIEEKYISSITCPFACDPVLKRDYSENSSLPIRIGYAGRLEYEQKRMDLILKLLELLVKKNVCFQMEIAGDGAAKEDMEKFVSYHHLVHQVQFLGRLEREKIPAFWKRQDICVNLADYEGRSIMIIEAMGNGAVPVVTATSGVSDDIIDAVNGYIVPLQDYEAAANRIEYLEKHRKQLRKLGKLAHDEVYPKSLMEQHVEDWKEILNLKQ